MTKNRAQITVRGFLPVAGIGEEALNQMAKPEPANRLQLLAEQSASWRDLQHIRPDGNEKNAHSAKEKRSHRQLTRRLFEI
ncbi:hypothetical protein OAL47_00835 [Verrucomicrobia bacterium]|nr:hypothetical protein [Verrucomicrobiota bacterium]